MNLASLLALASFSSKSRRSLFDIAAKRSCSALVFSLFASFSAFAAAFSAFAIAIARRRAYSRSRASTALSAFSCSFRRASILAADFNSSRAIERCFSSASLTIRSRASCAARFSLYRFLESAVTGAAFPFFPAALLDLPALAFFPPDFWRFASSDFVFRTYRNHAPSATVAVLANTYESSPSSSTSSSSSPYSSTSPSRRLRSDPSAFELFFFSPKY